MPAGIQKGVGFQGTGNALQLMCSLKVFAVALLCNFKRQGNYTLGSPLEEFPAKEAVCCFLQTKQSEENREIRDQSDRTRHSGTAEASWTEK
ncbi:hypothetical protein EYF80_035864 [Liparis tanakae]|uniref:Uncharacterized protein n=1 Tax=Liparis tanakae TaxID=230148 RepID=A0A4Z2GKI2_9TELE|nr:hypothetical protein EYF80_035864 [Liparis tanakae]